MRSGAPDPKGAASAAEAGIADSPAALAEMLVNGGGGPHDITKAIRLCEQAAAKGHSGAMFALSAIYSSGHGTVDRAAAERWFRAAAERGHGHAQLMLGRYLRRGAAGQQNLREARHWFESAIEQGIVEAEAELAELAPVLSRATG